jgi:5-formyltetrahydrofolate cyclo-ligase
MAMRRLLRQRREELPLKVRIQAAHAATQLLLQAPIFQASKHIACYRAFKSEIDTTFLIQHIWAQGKSCYLPVLNEDKQRATLKFVPYQALDKLHSNRYGISEPNPTLTPIPLHELQLIIVPLVAFDRAGHRLGMGGGYYDQTFHAHPSLKLVGFAYACQEVQAIPVDPWDVPLHAIVTEREFIQPGQ